MQILSKELPPKLILIQIWLCQWHIELNMMSLMTISPFILSFRQYKNANNANLVYFEKKPLCADLGLSVRGTSTFWPVELEYQVAWVVLNTFREI